MSEITPHYEIEDLNKFNDLNISSDFNESNDFNISNNSRDSLIISIDIPGADRHSIILNISETTVFLKAEDSENPERTYSAKIALPCLVNPSAVSATCRNGVLKIVVAKLEIQ